MERAKYSSDLTDKQWQIIIEPLLALPSSKAGRPSKYNLREVINAIFYILEFSKKSLALIGFQGLDMLKESFTVSNP